MIATGVFPRSVASRRNGNFLPLRFLLSIRRSSVPTLQGFKSGRSQCTLNDHEDQSFAESSPASGGDFVTTSNSSDVAITRTFPEMAMSSFETWGCSSQSKSKRSLTLWSCCASWRIAPGYMEHAAFLREPKEGKLQMG